MLNPVESRVLDLLDFQGLNRFLRELVRIPSLGGHESPAQHRVAEWMDEAGMEVDTWDLDLEGLRRHPAYSAEIHREAGLGVVGIIGASGGGRDLILNGHVDVVPPGDEGAWSFSPWEGGIVEGRIRGRGSLDMKGGLVAALFAGKAILDAGVRLKGRLIMESVIGEEDGGVGTLAAVERGYRADGAVIMEPTSLAICPAQAGALNFRITTRGKAAHGCVRDQGVSALEKFEIVHKALLTLEQRRNHACSDPRFSEYEVPFPISVGVIEGGDWASSVPDWIRVEGRYGIRPGEGLEKAKEEFLRALVGLEAADPWFRDHPPELEWWGGCFHPAEVPDEAPIVLGLQDSFQVLGMESGALKGVTFGSDMRLLVREGATPTVLFGPGDIRRAHAADESVSLEEVQLATRILALTALRFCGYEDEPSV